MREPVGPQWEIEGVVMSKTLVKMIEEYTLEDPPPPGHPELGKWVWSLFEAAYSEKERLGLMDRWVSNYKLFRGNHWGDQKRSGKDLVSVNLYFANVQRTVANITAKNPVVEVVDLDGREDEADQVLSTKMRKYWHESEQQATLSKTCMVNEIYGITIEKHGWTRSKKEPYSVVVDPYSFFPAPNSPHDLQDTPYLIHAYSMSVPKIQSIFGAEEVQADDVRTILGRSDREDVRPNAVMTDRNTGIVHNNYKNANALGPTDESRAGGGDGDGLVVECWIRDDTRPDIYPDGIRVISITNRGDVVLDDMPNPNLNFELEPEEYQETYAFGRFPFSYTNSYEDSTSIWGFSAAEQVGDLNRKIDEIVSRMAAYVNRALFPPLVVEKGCGITTSMINNKPGLVLMPTKPNARIEYLQVPNLPSNLFDILDVFTSMHDRIYQIEDADRGVQPTGVTAASAIVALQDRNAVLIQHKIRAMEYIARERGRWAISALQNFSTEIEQVEVRGTPLKFQGVALAGRRFNYMVESGSTVARTSIQREEQAMAFYDRGIVDRQAVLENAKFPGWKEIIERVGEGQLDQALQILVQAGLDEQAASELRQYLMEPQNGPEAQQANTSKQPQPGTPKAAQGKMAGVA
jgi:hypothetical protein